MDSIRLMVVFARVGILNELQYRVNFFFQVLESAISLVTGLIGLGLVFRHTTVLAGWTPPELLVVMGIYVLMSGVVQAVIQPNMLRLAQDVLEGKLDYVLTKPVDAQLLLSIREWQAWRFTNVLVGLLVIGWALIWMQADLQIGTVILFGMTLVCGLIVLYAFWLILATTSFWVIQIESLINLFEGVFAAGRWPVSIYPSWLRALLTFVVPVAFAVTVPAETLTNRLTPQTLALAIGMSVGLLLIARRFLRWGLSRYSGASA
ncbi:MAG: ABC transporter permease [Chloroflexus sp.]|uniref:ABC transporter permease n=1 Tax=Chloroflexus sp. TaxID=1904827 RepID=UPI0021DE42D4|nr:ABC-2 family transporter protein [Chloroflexus sp.]GIV88971.1 MAG: ABC transporter permease [Chloroflexus sp.]